MSTQSLCLILVQGLCKTKFCKGAQRERSRLLTSSHNEWLVLAASSTIPWLKGTVNSAPTLPSLGSWDWRAERKREPWATGAVRGQVRICFCPVFQSSVFIWTIHTNDSARLGLGDPGGGAGGIGGGWELGICGVGVMGGRGRGFKKIYSEWTVIKYDEGWGFS